MIAFILAAGEGSRLRPLTEGCPKPMIEIGGRPILEHNVRLLAAHGFDNLIINLHHRPAAITEYFGDGSAWGVHITYSYEPVLLGTAGALLPVRDRLSERFVLMYGDNLTDIDLSRLISRHADDEATATMALFHRPDATASGVAATDGQGRITRFVEKPHAGNVFSPWVNAGIIVFEPAVLDFIVSTGTSDVARDLIPSLIEAGRRITAYRMTERLWWIDSIDDFDRTTAAFACGQATLP